jgi:hypothetical protein
MIGWWIGVATAAAGPCIDDPKPIDLAAEPQPELIVETPAADVEVGPVVCMAQREVWRDKTGRLRVCTVRDSVVVHGIAIAPEAYTWFHVDGRPNQTQLAKATMLSTALGREVGCAAGALHLDAQGQLLGCRLTATTTMGGASCAAGSSIAFFPDGNKRSCQLQAPFVVHNTELPRGATVTWGPGGAVYAFTSPKPVHLGPFWVGSALFYADRTVRWVRLTQPAQVHGIAFPFGASLHWRPDASLQDARFEADSGHLPHGELWSDMADVWFNCASVETRRTVEHIQDEIGERAVFP